ncbi:hypothetical protein [Gordonia sihwensis]|uniref:hypothetical protein n=1 Tax=Gordonia sihwensis TaxID=173559 RepID=UPI003D98CD52
MTGDAHGLGNFISRNRTPLVVIIVGVVIAVIASVVVFTHAPDESSTSDTSYASQETLSAEGAADLWQRWSAAREACDAPEMAEVASREFIAQWQSDEGHATSIQQACRNASAHAQYKSTTTLSASGDPSYSSGTEGTDPALTITYRVQKSDLLGGNASSQFARMLVTYGRGSDGLWRIVEARWLDPI